MPASPLSRGSAPVRAAALLLPVFALLGGCGASERRPDPGAGTFRMSEATHGDERVLALVANGESVPFVRLVDAPPDAADGAEIDSGADGVDGIADWRFTSFSRGLYRIGSAGADDRLSLAADYAASSGGVVLALSKRSAFQLWYVVPLADGRCRLTSALFPDASLDVAADGRALVLAPSTDDASGQRWRFAPLAGTSADGLPSLCTGAPR